VVDASRFERLEALSGYLEWDDIPDVFTGAWNSILNFDVILRLIQLFARNSKLSC
jgi:hypothetical protein